MADQIFIRPAREGLIVRDPISKQALPDAGVWKNLRGQTAIYWRRRIACGDVLVGEVPAVLPLLSAPEVKTEVVEPERDTPPPCKTDLNKAMAKGSKRIPSKM